MGRRILQAFLLWKGHNNLVKTNILINGELTNTWNAPNKSKSGIHWINGKLTNTWNVPNKSKSDIHCHKQDMHFLCASCFPDNKWKIYGVFMHILHGASGSIHYQTLSCVHCSLGVFGVFCCKSVRDMRVSVWQSIANCKKRNYHLATRRLRYVGFFKFVRKKLQTDRKMIIGNTNCHYISDNVANVTANWKRQQIVIMLITELPMSLAIKLLVFIISYHFWQFF